jgi:hypothetical protein
MLFWDVIGASPWSMIPKSGNWFSDKIMLNHRDKTGFRFNAVEPAGLAIYPAFNATAFNLTW